MKIKVLSSGSHGNCYVIEGIKEKIIIECGIDINKIIEAVNYDFRGVIGCFVTHEHKDHSKSIKKMSKHTSVYASKGTLHATEVDGIVLSPLSITSSNEFEVIPFKTNHDAVEPLGFFIKNNIEQKIILFATDTYYIKYNFQNIDLFMVECNYSIKKLENNKNLPEVVARRLLSSHFELENFIEFLEKSNAKGKKICPIHMSEGNLDFGLMKEKIENIGKFINIYENEEFEI